MGRHWAIGFVAEVLAITATALLTIWLGAHILCAFGVNHVNYDRNFVPAVQLDANQIIDRR